MVDRILVPIDRSEQAQRACQFVVEEFPEATLVLLHVINPAEAGFSAQSSLPSFSEEWYEKEQEEADRLFEDIERELGDATAEHVVEVGTPTNVIIDYADDNDIDHIVMGSHGRDGVTRILLGSVAETVVRRASVPVTVTR
jgi:nucleotide-binding universal stress UspA family protein